MVQLTVRNAALLAIALVSATPAAAGWKQMSAGQPANVDGITITPHREWNQSGKRPGKTGRTWTQDGTGLNSLEIFATIGNGQSIYRERSKKGNPMPKFDPGMLLPDLADFFERSFRAQFQVTDFTVLETAPETFIGFQGLKVTYSYTLPNDELARLGEVRLANVKGKLYLINYNAPRLHYFEAGLSEAQSIMDGARIK